MRLGGNVKGKGVGWREAYRDDEEEYLIIINNESQGYEYVAQNQLLAANYDDNVVAPGGFVIDKVK